MTISGDGWTRADHALEHREEIEQVESGAARALLLLGTTMLLLPLFVVWFVSATLWTWSRRLWR